MIGGEHNYRVFLTWLDVLAPFHERPLSVLVTSQLLRAPHLSRFPGPKSWPSDRNWKVTWLCSWCLSGAARSGSRWGRSASRRSATQRRRRRRKTRKTRTKRNSGWGAPPSSSLSSSSSSSSLSSLSSSEPFFGLWSLVCEPDARKSTWSSCLRSTNRLLSL